ncbi:MAG: hypothetical protein N3G22_02290 [Candidatus Micrarchaeota archaeon]|nr:hypothetical protein [Candidatus Micrarchaeota archaeon]
MSNHLFLAGLLASIVIFGSVFAVVSPISPQEGLLDPFSLASPAKSSPDLRISGIILPGGWTGSVTVGVPFQVGIITKNIGDDSAGASTTYYSFSGSNGAFSIGPLAPNATSINYTNLTCTQAGNFNLTVVADYYNTVEESNETNNQVNLPITCLPPKPDLVILSISAPENATVGTPFTANITTKNIGNGSAGASTTFYNASGNTGSISVGALNPGASQTDAVSITCASEGMMYITATADWGAVVDESNETNNANQIAVNCLPPMPDLIVSNIDGPSSAVVGQGFDVSITTKNIGEADAGMFETTYTFQGTSADLHFDSLGVGNERTDIVSLSCTEAGNFSITATADSYEGVLESNEGNNQLSHSIECLSGAPDIVIPTMSVPQTALRGVPFDVWVLNYNSGNAAAAPFYTAFIFGNSTKYAFVESGLAPGAGYWKNVTFTCTQVGFFNVTAIADYNETVSESNEENNNQTSQIECLPAPDLVISRIVAPANVTVNKSFEVQITTENIGDAQAGASQISVSFDGGNPKYAPLPAIEPGLNYTSTVSIACTKLGLQNLNAAADYYDNVTESDETNNQLVVQVNCVLPTVEVAYADGWNMVSLPVAVSNNSSSAIWPEGISSLFEFSATGGYRPVSEAQPGKGYWIKFSGAHNKNYTGYGLPYLNSTVSYGWNIIGGLTETVNLSSIKTEPAGIIASDFFWFNGANYERVTTALHPGRGYWVKMSQAGRLILNNSALYNQEIPASTAGMGYISISDSKKASMSVYLGSSSKAALPPIMSGFDARYSTDTYIEAPPASGSKDYEIKITASNYPLKVEWKLNSGYAYTLYYTSGGVQQSKPISGTGSFLIYDSAVKKLTLRVTKQAGATTTTTPTASTKITPAAD